MNILQIKSKISYVKIELTYNIKKREEVQEMPQEEPNPLMRKKKTPEELAAEAEAEDEDELTKLKNVIETHVMDIKTQIERDDGVGGKCGRGVTAGEMNRGGRRDEEELFNYATCDDDKG
ncbi:hypothetical protein HZH68_002838 [Vespula germanica]|uniref:Uncharacterized protein n=1 Tax=Vespula germanica TaxID=30212 RepID=A0A834NN09_VESGE|nr:hypothetical protein HZH68_002838 [Vespula germanica]